MQRLRTNCAAEDVMALEAHIAENGLQKAEVIDEVERCLSIAREVKAEVDTNLTRAEALRQSVLAAAFAPDKTEGTTP